MLWPILLVQGHSHGHPTGKPLIQTTGGPLHTKRVTLFKPFVRMLSRTSALWSVAGLALIKVCCTHLFLLWQLKISKRKPRGKKEPHPWTNLARMLAPLRVCVKQCPFRFPLEQSEKGTLKPHTAADTATNTQTHTHTHIRHNLQDH